MDHPQNLGAMNMTYMRDVLLATASAGLLAVAPAATATAAAAPPPCAGGLVCNFAFTDFGNPRSDYDLSQLTSCFNIPAPATESVVNSSPWAIQYWSNQNCQGQTVIVDPGVANRDLAFPVGAQSMLRR
ncbi:hypothetical protein [Saccharopolyspora shandongensis]|uniref:hypothetical protein n=1 Tax=Saccharopolyspora shandongensis TaxID=418495 RepID=UPI0033C7DB7E